MARFTASLIGGQNIVFRPYIEVNDDNIRFKIPGFLSGDEQTMLIENITDIRISGDIVSKTIEIYSSGLGVIKAKGFSPSDARQIKQQIERNRQTIKDGNSRISEEDFFFEQQLNTPKTQAEIAVDQFTRLDMIPLITFSNNPQALISTLNSLLHYAAGTVSNLKDFHRFESDKKKLQLYTLKINEGLRLGKSLKGDNYFTNELARIETEISAINNKVGLSKAKKKKGKVIWYIIIAFILYSFARACTH